MTDWRFVNSIETLAAAYAEIGEFEEAIKHQQKTLSFGESKDRLEGMRKRLEELNAQQPIRVDPGKLQPIEPAELELSVEPELLRIVPINQL